MADEKDKGEGRPSGRPKVSRQDRLKQALRENLKRRKSQARQRDQIVDLASDGDRCPDGRLGKRDGDGLE